MFKKMCIIVQCVFQFVFPNVSSVLHCLLQLFLRTFVLHKLQTTLLCMDTLIHVRPSPFALTLSHVFTWENSHTQHLQPHQSQHTCVHFLFLWERSMQCQWGWGEWKAELLEQAVAQSLWLCWVYEKWRKAACELEQMVTFGLFFKTAGGGKYKENRNRRRGGRYVSICSNLFGNLRRAGGGDERERNRAKEREEHCENLFTLL